MQELEADDVAIGRSGPVARVGPRCQCGDRGQRPSKFGSCKRRRGEGLEATPGGEVLRRSSKVREELGADMEMKVKAAARAG